jgi:pimeloyl-ACP methyl ester carboxylesterase
VIRLTATSTVSPFFVGDVDWIKLRRTDDVTPTPTLPVVTIEATDATATEGVAGDVITFTLTRTGGDLTQPLVVQLSAPTGSATPGTDYAVLPTSVTIPANSATAIFSITPIVDAIVENDETVIVSLASPITGDGYVLSGTTTATVTVQDDDNSIEPEQFTLTGNAVSSEYGFFDWSDVADAAAYQLEISSDGVDYFGSSLIENGATEFEYGGFDAGEQFTFRVLAINISGTIIATSNTLSLTFPGNGGGVAPLALSVASVTPVNNVVRVLPNPIVVGFNGYYLTDDPLESFGNQWFERIVRDAGDNVTIKPGNPTFKAYDFNQRQDAFSHLIPLLAVDGNQVITAAEATNPKIIVMGYSLGGVEAANFSALLARTGSFTFSIGAIDRLYSVQSPIQVDKLITLDPVTGGLAPLGNRLRLPKGRISSNVQSFVNYYQSRGGSSSFDLYSGGSSNNGQQFLPFLRVTQNPIDVSTPISALINGVALKHNLPQNRVKQINLSNGADVTATRVSSNVTFWGDAEVEETDPNEILYDSDLKAGGVEHLSLPWYVRGGLGANMDDRINVRKDVANA